MQAGRIRPIAVGIFYHGDKILVGESYDPLRALRFYRPLGGGIEFGERGEETLIRELREELGAEVRDLRYLDTLESIFFYQGQPGHEIVRIYEGRFVDPAFYAQEVVLGHEDNGVPFRAVWQPLAEFEAGRYPLYPDGLLELLRRHPR